MAKQLQKKLTTQPHMTLAETMQRFSTEDACKAHLRDLRWPAGVCCPRCGNAEVREVSKRPFHWQCRACNKNGYRFSVTSGSIFENTKYPLRTWFEVIYLISQSKKGISALQIHRQIGSGNYETAWYMCTRVRAAMKNQTFDKLIGTVEVDETYIGGKNKNRHWNKKTPWKAGNFASGKVGVIGAISRKGNVVAQVIERADTEALTGFVREVTSSKVDLVVTDEHTGYGALGVYDFPHKTVTHSDHEYVRGEIHTQNIESFWALLKRGVIGTYHNVSKKYLPLYLNEFTFRHNHRHDPDIFNAILSRA